MGLGAVGCKSRADAGMLGLYRPPKTHFPAHTGPRNPVEGLLVDHVWRGSLSLPLMPARTHVCGVIQNGFSPRVSRLCLPCAMKKKISFPLGYYYIALVHSRTLLLAAWGFQQSMHKSAE